MVLEWEFIEHGGRGENSRYDRLKVPSGWLVRAIWRKGMTMAFIPDEKHTWVVNEE